MGTATYASDQFSAPLTQRLFDRSMGRGTVACLLSLPLAIQHQPCYAQSGPLIQNRAGVRMTVDTEDHDPAIRVSLPGPSGADRSFNILLPEHVTVRPHGSVDANHLYVFQPGQATSVPEWKSTANSLSYQADLGSVRFKARATLEEDGILFHYDFQNSSDIAYDMVWAVTDPRFKVFFYDPRLERTYVHQKSGFTLIASETPERLKKPLSEWLPARYHAQYTAPVPSETVQHRADGITYYYRREAIDVPMIATVSTDGKWVAASFAKDPGNVWTNPELTCQHVDPQVSLPKHGHAYYEIKILLLKGSLNQAYQQVLKQRSELKASEATR